eukprot:17998_1
MNIKIHDTKQNQHQPNSATTKRITCIVSAFVFGVLGYYYYYSRSQEISIKKKLPNKTQTTSKPQLSQARISSSITTIKTKIWKIKSEKDLSFDDYLKNTSIKEAGDALRSGHLIGFPTETVYGLGANAFSNIASNKIFVAKGRPSDNPLIVHISETSQLTEWILNPIQSNTNIHPVIETLIQSFWPGPLSIVFPYICDARQSADETTKVICPTVRGGGQLQSVAVRMPSNQIARALITLAGCPIAAPSANISGRPSPTNGKHVITDMKHKIYGILDCGEVSCDVGLESTVIKMDEANDRIVILRPGGVTRSMMIDAIGTDSGIDIVYSKDVMQVMEDTNVEAPGMKYRHYAPKKPLYLVQNSDLFADMFWFYKGQNKQDSVVFIVSKQNALSARDNNTNVLIIGDANHLDEIAANLFIILRKIDDEEQYKNIKVIFCETFENNDIGVAIMNRLEKASQTNKIIKNMIDLHSIAL